MIKKQIFIQSLISDLEAQILLDEIIDISTSEFFHYSDPDFEYLKRTKSNNFPTKVNNQISFLQSHEFIASLEVLTGISNLKSDPDLWGGGVHITEAGGYLAMHQDFNVLPTSFKSDKKLLRVLNLILFLSHGAALQLDGISIDPIPGRAVLFTTPGCIHGHPIPTKTTRTSIAIYYYIEENVPRNAWHSTKYLPLPFRSNGPELNAKRLERASIERYKKWLE